MRGLFLLACVSVALAATVACASSGDEAAVQPPAGEPPDAGLPLTDAGVHEAEVDTALEPPTCSAAGWCITPLPDTDLMLKDIWPLPGRAFAIAESRTLGVRVLEWEEASATWKYIDDNTQNATGFGTYVGRMWAADENDVYFTIAPRTVYHGRREAPSKDWSWSRHQLEDNSPDSLPYHDHGYPLHPQLIFDFSEQPYPALGVWGLGRDDVYAWYSNTIYHWTSADGGAPGWAPEYIADNPDAPGEHLYVLGAAGTNRDEVWFSIARDRPYEGSCAVLLRKTPGGYKRLADGVVEGSDCQDRPGVSRLGGMEGWLTDLQAPKANRLIGLKGARDIVRIAVDGDSYSVAAAPVPTAVAESPLMSVWSAPDDQVWLSGWGIVVRGADVWDGGAYRISSISLNGAPIGRPIYQVRGTSNSNLWAIGVRHAFHKTTP